MCSDFPEDSEVQKINTIAAIRHAIRKGYTIVMTQTGSIHGSFYDVFNQYFKIIEEPNETKFYANIAIGSNLKQCQVHEDFQCIVVIKMSDLSTTPGPFLNRFEKYSLSHKDFLEARLTDFPPKLKSILSAVKDKVDDFMNHFEHSSFYGAVHGETVNSLLLSILPECDFEFGLSGEDSNLPCDGKIDVLQYILHVLQTEAGMRFTMVSSSKDMVWKIKPCDGIGEAFLSDRYTAAETVSYINSAMMYLLSTNTDHEQITPEAQFVVSVISQLLVIYLCRKLVNIMTAEGFVFGQKKMPPWCVETYLFDQNHFSLKDTITSYFRELQLCGAKSAILPQMVCNKVVCFTHTSLEVHGLPGFSSAHNIEDLIFINTRRVIFDNLDKVYLCKMSSIFSEKAFRNHLMNFLKIEKEIMITVIDMQETSVQVVNHVRIIVEEAETSVAQRKLFIFLLHFPSSLYHKPCYPAIFANGWDHCYLDTVLPQTLNIRQWFKAAFQPSCATENSHLFQEDMLCNFRKDAVEVISSRVLIGSPNGGSFNSKCKTDEKFKRFQKFLDGPVGDTLVALYIRCWEQPELAFCLKEAAEHTRNNMTSLSISEVVHDHFRTTFYNFLSFMIHNINTDLNVDLIFDYNKDSQICQLFLQLMDLLPLPKIAEIKAYNNTFDSRQPEAFKPSFPFFWKVSSALDYLVEEAIKEYQMKRTLEHQPKQVQTHTFAEQGEEVISIIVSNLNQKLRKDPSTDMLSHILTVLDQQPQLWEEYKRHFLCSKCHIRGLENPIVASAVDAHFGIVFAVTDVKERLASLHYQAYVESDHLDVFSQLSFSAPQLLRGGPSETNEEAIITNLFRIFSSNSMSDNGVEIAEQFKELKSWYSLMLEQMSNPSFKQFVFKQATQHVYQSKLHVMAAIFYLMQSQQSHFGSNDDYKFVLAVQQSLISQFSAESGSWTVGLSTIMKTLLKFTEQVTVERGQESQKFVAINMTHFLEAILGYFINAQRPYTLNRQNLEWFLHDLNKVTSDVARISGLIHDHKKWSIFLNFQVHLFGQTMTSCFNGSSMARPLGIFCIDIRKLVGQELYNSRATPSPYFPQVYREKLKSSNSSQLEDAIVQPLADVYYECLMEHLEVFHSRSFIMVAKSIQDVKDKINLEKDISEKILLQIELQALVQAALNGFASELVSHYWRQKTKLPDLNKMNSIISENASDCHKRMVMVYLLRHLRSPYALNEFLDSPTAREMASVLEQVPPVKFLLELDVPPLHLFSFMDPQTTDKLGIAYRSVSRLMHEISSNGKNLKNTEKEVRQLLKGDEPISDAQGLKIDTKSFLKMSVWLVTYYDFFIKKKTPFPLAEALNQRGCLSFLDFTPQQICVLQCFLKREFIKKEESIQDIPSTDPLYELFASIQNVEDAGLCNAVANMVAVGFSLPPKRTHLWSFLFDQKASGKTLLPGFVRNKPASAQQCYSRESGLMPDESFYEYGPALPLLLSLHSMYFLLLQNFGALSIAMLTQRDSQELIHGGIISKEVSVRYFCADNLRLLWKKLLLCVDGDASLRPLLVIQCLQKLLKMVHTQPMRCSLDSEFSDTHERVWHSDIYTEVKCKLKQMYQKQCSLMKEGPFVTLRYTDDHCLHFPSLTMMKHDLVEHVGIASGGPQILLKFMNIYQRLSVGSALLPLLVKMYDWLNTHLAHLLTNRQAGEKSIEEILQLASKRFSRGTSHPKEPEILDVFERMITDFNKFLDISGGFIMYEGTCIEKIDGDTKIIKLLTTGYGNDWLCLTVDIIVDLHNSLISLDREGENRLFHSLLSDFKQNVYGVSQFKQNMAIVWESHNNNLDQELTSLFYSRCSHSRNSGMSTGREYQWDELECDVVRQYIVGKPQLSDANRSLRRPFRFRDFTSGPTEHAKKASNGVTSPGYPMDIAALHQELPGEYKKLSLLCQEDKPQLELEFHKLDYTSLSKLVQSLRNAAGRLCEKLLQEREHSQSKTLSEDESLPNKTLMVLYNTDQLNETIGTLRLGESIIMKFKVTQLYEILKMFVEWIDSCYFAFCELPYTLKQHLPGSESEWMQEALQARAADEMPSSLDLVTDLENALSHLITMGINHLMQQPSFELPLSEYVTVNNLCDQKVCKIIPRGIHLEHIVHFIILLRRVKNELENDSTPAHPQKEWLDKVNLSLPNFASSPVDFTLSQQEAHRTRYTSSSEVTIWVDHKIDIPSSPSNDLGPVTSWTVKEVLKWLQSIKLGKYTDMFEREEIDGEELAEYDHECLQEIGMISKVDRVKLLTKLQHHK